MIKEHLIVPSKIKIERRFKNNEWINSHLKFILEIMNEMEDGIYQGLKWRNRQSGGWLPILVLRKTFYICVCLKNTVNLS